MFSKKSLFFKSWFVEGESCGFNFIFFVENYPLIVGTAS